ncbi:hypothetical protein CWR41_01395 [Cedecea lapagei]|nr:hypothetical protein CWR41_01395 [Cedecea lapagei]
MSRAVSATLTLAPGSQAWVTASNHFGEPVKNPPNVADFFYPLPLEEGARPTPAYLLFTSKTSVPRWVYSTFCNLKLVI